MERLKVGVVGAGKRFESMYYPVLSALSNVEIVGFVTKSGTVNNKFEKYPVFQNIADIIEQTSPDFLLAVVPLGVNSGIIREACRLKCNILVETPVASMQEVEELVPLVRESEITAGVIEQWPFLPMECFKKKMIDSGLLGDMLAAENDYRTYQYHGSAQLRNYLDKNANFVKLSGRIARTFPLADKPDPWNITLAELDNGTIMIYKYSELYKRVEVRNFKSIRAYGSKGTIISDCLLDNEIEKFSIIWENGETYHLTINKIYNDETKTIKEISTLLPDGQMFKWENKFNEHPFDEHQIGIAQHIDTMVKAVSEGGEVLWSIEDGFKDLMVL